MSKFFDWLIFTEHAPLFYLIGGLFCGFWLSAILRKAQEK